MSDVDYFQDLETIVALALAEDIGQGDITAQLVPDGQFSEARVLVRQKAVVCGAPWFNEVYRQIDPDVDIVWHKEEGDEVHADDYLVSLKGATRSLLTGERAALNFLQTLMGTATTAKQYANALVNSTARILDTRKTIPGLRLAQKYAVQVGGCSNHRIGLYDAYLIKENHIMAAGGIAKAIGQARKAHPDYQIEIEVETIGELEQALDSGADIIMLDNFDQTALTQAAQIKTAAVKYERSGNLSKSDIEKGIHPAIDFISCGALTKHCEAIDLSMRISI